jgi:ABC-type glycerol-3-phosphate transport system substrate-binding protein
MKKRALFVAVAIVCCLIAVAPVFGQAKLTVWVIDLPDDDPTHAYSKALSEGFAAKNPDIKLDYVALGNDPLKDKTKTAMAANVGLPDIFQGWGGSVMGSYADAGRLLDLTADLKSVPGSKAAASAMTWKNKIYGVAPFFAVAGVFANEGLFKANNVALPFKSVADLEKAADIFVAKGIQPFACGAKDKWPTLALYMYLTDRYGGDIFTTAAARKAKFDSDAFVKAAQLYQSWVKKGYFGATPLGEAYGDAQQLMATGKAAMHVTGSWMCSSYSSADFTDQTIGFYAFPAITGGKGPVTDIMGMTDIGYTATAAGKANKAAIVKFMKYAMSVEAASAEPGRVCSVPGVKAPSKLTEQASAVFGTAKMVQFWWDQNLPAQVTTPLNETIQTFFLADTDVKASLAKFEALATENMGKVK